MNPKKFAALTDRIKRERGLSFQEQAEAVGVGQNYLSNCRGGGARPSMTIIVALRAVAAGLAPMPEEDESVRPRMQKATKLKEAIRMAEQGHSLHEIETRVGMSKSAIHRKVRGVAAAAKKQRKEHVPAWIADVRELLKRLPSERAVSLHLGLKHSTFRRLLAKHAPELCGSFDPPSWLAAAVQRLESGMRYSAIAREIGIPESTIRDAISRRAADEPRSPAWSTRPDRTISSANSTGATARQRQRRC